MKLSILRYYISILLIAVSLSAMSQDTSPSETSEEVSDSIKFKDKYGLRVGLDLSLPIRSLINSDLTGFEAVADFRVTKRIYAAAELGYYDRYEEEDYIKFSTNGSYIKIGTNYNLYKNWLGMTNEIFVGVRYGFSSFTQTIHEYNPNFYGTYFPEETVILEEEFDGLTAHWGEFVMGLKAEIFTNLYMGMSFSLKKMVSQTQPYNFLNMYIPGFERVYLNETGFSFNYTLTYNIPIFKKDI
ncbi:MAG: DUF6048 family protein [Urechidicola sp.]|nr:DUF6048 family protein [Urechidicola sp.]